MREIRRGTREDILEIGAVYDRILTEEEAGLASVGWVRGVYPTESTALEALEAGELYGTVFNDAQGQAKAMLDLALALYHGEDPAQAVALEEEHYVWLPYLPVTRENLARFRDEWDS